MMTHCGLFVIRWRSTESLTFQWIIPRSRVRADSGRLNHSRVLRERGYGDQHAHQPPTKKASSAGGPRSRLSSPRFVWPVVSQKSGSEAIPDRKRRQMQCEIQPGSDSGFSMKSAVALFRYCLQGRVY